MIGFIQIQPSSMQQQQSWPNPFAAGVAPAPSPMIPFASSPVVANKPPVPVTASAVPTAPAVETVRIMLFYHRFSVL